MTRSPKAAIPASELNALVRLYRESRTADRARRPAPDRKALRMIATRLEAAADAIAGAAWGADAPSLTPLANAWRAIHLRARESGWPAPMADSTAVDDCLRLWAQAARVAERAVPKTRYPAAARQLIADRLRQVFLAHRIRWSAYSEGAAVRCLVEIATAAGDKHLTAAAARKVLTKSGKHSAARMPRRRT